MGSITLHEQNRRSWNHATRAHNSHKGDQVAFFREGGSTLFPEEVELLGDVQGKRLVHLQCNAGQDTLSIARLGAHVMGVDISDTAIEFAQALSRDSGIAAEFERADVFDFLEGTAARYDVAFASYGALCWLSDLSRWAHGVARVLVPNGRLVVMEFHPLINLLDLNGNVAPLGRVSGGNRIDWKEGVGDYVAQSDGALSPGEHVPGSTPFTNPEMCHEFEWSVAEVVDAVARVGLRIEGVREYDYSNGCRFAPTMVAREGRRWVLPDGGPPIPFMYSLTARR